MDTVDPVHQKTPLMTACEKGYILLVETLLNNKAQANCRGPNERVPLHYVIDSPAENVDVVSLLIN